MVLTAATGDMNATISITQAETINNAISVGNRKIVTAVARANAIHSIRKFLDAVDGIDE